MKHLQTHIQKLFRTKPELAGNASELSNSLKLKKSQLPVLQKVLREMVDQKLLVFDKGKYRIPIKAGKTIGKESPRGPQKKPDITKQKSENYLGVFSAHPDGFGFVAVDQLKQSIFIPPGKIGGALDGDLVTISLEKSKRDGRQIGVLQDVTERRRRKVRGFVHIEHGRWWVMPLNEKIPPIFVDPDERSEKYIHDQLVETEILEYPEDSHTAPAGRIVKAIPEGDSPKRIIEHILADLQLETEFSSGTIQEMKDLPTNPPEEVSGNRRNLIELPFVTIDGEDARDFDDAICLETIKSGGYRLWVAIADVAHYVQPGMAVDKDAFQRGTSVYFPHRVIPMLPEALSNELCSLKPDVPRLAMVCEMVISENGETTDYSIYNALIRSKGRLTYTTVSQYLDTREPATLGTAKAHASMLENMGALAERLAEKRGHRGALSFVFPEARFELDKKGMPKEIIMTMPNVATKLIEQFMLEANETVARHCEKLNLPVLFRVHDPPPQDQISNLLDTLNRYGITPPKADLSTPQGVNLLLKEIEENPNRDTLELSVLKTMSQAQYRATNDGHFGLAATHYCHFTSPIRRYPDLVVHRALKASLEKNQPPVPLAPDAGMRTSLTERNAGEAENRVAKLYKVLFLESRIGEIFPGTVSGVNARGLWVTLRDVFADGLLPISMLPDDNYRLDSKRNALRGMRKKKEIRSGARLTIQLVKANRHSQEVEFSFDDWGWDEENYKDSAS